MAYGTIKIDTITFTNGGVDKSISVSGLTQNPTFSGNVTVTGTVSGTTVRATTVSGVTVSGTTVNAASGVFTTQISGAIVKVPAGTAGAPTVQVGTGATVAPGLYGAGTDQLGFSTGGASVFVIDSVGQIRVVNSGTAAAPALIVGNDINTGLYSPGADQLAFSTGGTGRLFVDSSGNVGIGGAPTAVKLFVNGQIVGTNDAYALRASNGSGTGQTTIGLTREGASTDQKTWELMQGGGGEMLLRTVNDAYSASQNAIDIRRGSSYNVDNISLLTMGSSRLYINSGGNVGIGTTSPTGLLHVENGNILVNGGFVRAQCSGSAAITSRGFRQTIDGTEYLAIYHDNNGAAFNVNSVERLRITSAGKVGIGTSAPFTVLHSSISITGGNPATSGTTDANVLARFQGGSVGLDIGATAGGAQWIQPRDVNSFATNYGLLLCPNGGNVGISTTSPGTTLDVQGEIRSKAYGGEGGQLTLTNASNTNVFYIDVDGIGTQRIFTSASNKDIQIGQLIGTGCNIAFYTESTERARIDSSGRLLVGTSSIVYGAPKTIIENSSSSIDIFRVQCGAVEVAGNIAGLAFGHGPNGSRPKAAIGLAASGSYGRGDLVFYVDGTADDNSVSSSDERMRITNSGVILIAKTADDINTQGIRFSEFGVGSFCRDAEIPLFVNRNTDDGALVVFRQAGVDEGNISVSGTTVSYNGAHLSRWSQLPSGDERTEILRGSVLSNIDEMCEWSDEDNEQLNRMKVSDVEGDKNVSGVFQAWDDDDDTYTNDFYCAMTGDFIIRIAEGVIVERGDLLMSAGDGTAKPQNDDIIRSKTVAKVTSTNVSCTYDDGSYCVPCVLMAC